ncbi:MAG: PIG-L family deacetylase [Opitutaceae bacterium]|nr:PIG-L family deacetylase [Opitutaceae bacterium]
MSPFKILTASLSFVLPLVSSLNAAEAGGDVRHAMPASLGSGAILQELHSFLQLGRVLYVAAHPDDENTRLLSYFAKGRGYATGYLSLTRGDGGQNLLGSELRDQLGVIRTQELLAARRIDGAVQFFTRANDFGFSKTPDETLRIWDKTAVLSDVVRVIRRFRPDVILTRFSPEPGTTHGHHTASAILAAEAFAMAGDSEAFPEQIALDGLQPWKPVRVLWNSFSAGMRSGSREGTPATLQVDSGAYNTFLGESFGEIAARSRTQHKSQGFGSVANRGSGSDSFTVVAGGPASRDLFDGIETSWSRIPGGEKIGRAALAVIDAFNPQRPSASVPALMDIRELLLHASYPESPVVLADKRAQLEKVIFACLGMFVEATTSHAELVPGEEVEVKFRVLVRDLAPPLRVRWLQSRIEGKEISTRADQVLAPGRISERTATTAIAQGTSPSTPYWLKEHGDEGMFRVDNVRLIGTPENSPVLPVEHVFEINGKTITAADSVVQVIDDPIRGEIRRQVQVVPPVTLYFPQDLELFSPGEERAVWVEVEATRPGTVGRIEIEAPAGWAVKSSSQSFDLKDRGARARIPFTIEAPQEPATAMLGARATVNGAVVRTSRIDIRYDHIPAQLIQPPAQARLVSLNLAIKGKSVGYLPGAGDLVAESIRRMGCEVTILGSGDLTADRLRAFDSVVLGVRAFNTREDIEPSLPALFDYAQQGGTVIVQYNTTADLKSTRFAPYPLTLSRERVVDETAPVTILAVDHPAMTAPNRIGPADFEHWVQERGLYFPGRWDAHFTPLLSLADPGEPQRQGALLVAKHGKGWFVYTGLSFFRELPAGVPGAYRLFANLLSLGK